jgi:copper type II ascorbate-dependent monooxygenase-like protein
MLAGMRASAVICTVVICACGSNADRVPTWHRDIRPIVTQSCTGCHSTGSIAPFPFESYADLFGRQQLIREQVTSRRMPPWPPAPGCAEYADDRSLSEKDRTTLLTWLDHGAPEGNPADAKPVSSPPPGGLSRVDRDLRVAAPYIPVQVPDEYRCFLLDWPESARRYVTGFVAKPGNAAIVHHVLVFVAPPGQVSQFQALDDADPSPGYTCFGGPGGNVPTLGGWVPGSGGGDFPAGTGVPIDPGSKIILQVHYNRPRDGASDQTSLQLKLDDSVQRQAFVLPWADPSWLSSHTMNIPAGQADVGHAFTFAPGSYLGLITSGTIPAGPFTVYGAATHQHLRGTHNRLEIRRAGGNRECLLDIPRWDFHWQGSYALKTPTRVQVSDSLSIECHWDNSAAHQPDGRAPRDLNWGEGTDDEMCIGFLYITQ